jgi:hypothetical protein
MLGRMNDWSVEEVHDRIILEYIKRERIWADTILALDLWPVLFVCGSKHVDRFSAGLREAGVQVVIESEDWMPTPYDSSKTM